MWMEAGSLKCIIPIFESKFLKASAAEPAWHGLQLSGTRWQLWMGQFRASFQCSGKDNSFKKKEKKIPDWESLYLEFDLNTKIIIAITSCVQHYSSLVSVKMQRYSWHSYLIFLLFVFFFFECTYFWRFIHSGTRVAKWVHQQQRGRGNTAWEAGAGAGKGGCCPQKSGKCALGLRVCGGTEDRGGGGRMHKSRLNRAHNCW